MAKNTACPVCLGRFLRARPERLRDAEGIRVLECDDCTHVFLDSFDHINEAYFDRGEFLLNKPFLDGVDDRLRHYEHENSERFDRVGPLVVNKRVLDFGCGAGALIEKILPLAKSVEGLEKTEPFRRRLIQRGHRVHEKIGDLDSSYDVILAFHVVEHLPDPVESLRGLAKCLNPDGLIYLEVPNVNDALMTLYDVEPAQKFLFFQDHLQYLTRASLARTVKRAGLRVVTMSGHNRFGLANHLYWLRHGKPGGHKIWSFLESKTMFEEYSRMLAAADLSDTLVAEIRL
ncbi:MAG: class I SAM-dependent methyltransferase [Alphaproteobacteria bacterium]|nr:class I SAM-dependent methyltransferase [Alphaproteobacteria bacterium]